MNNKKIWIGLAVLLFFLIAAAGSYLFFKKFTISERQISNGSPRGVTAEVEDFFVLRMYYPSESTLQMVEKKLPRRSNQIAIAEAVIEEYFKGPADRSFNVIPQNVRLMGLYRDAGQTLYIDLSDELRRNFQGDAVTEFLLLKGIYESLISNLSDFQDVRILVDGKEIETLGGHLFLNYGLKNSVSYEVRSGDKKSDE